MDSKTETIQQAGYILPGFLSPGGIANAMIGIGKSSYAGQYNWWNDFCVNCLLVSLFEKK